MYTIIHHTMAKILTSIVVTLLLLGIHTATTAYEPDKTPENVQKKAVITKHNARLFSQSTGDSGDEATFMQIYFMMKPAAGNPTIGNRIPVTKNPYKTGTPDGWLEKNAYVEWNTLQMIKLEPQSGRKLAKIFGNQQCAELYGGNPQDHAGCQILGEEPNRFISTPNTDFQLLIPVFEKDRSNYQGGFIRVYQKGSAVQVGKQLQIPAPQQSGQKVLGYDIVFAVDSTNSMGKYFKPTTEVIQTFIQHTKRLVQGGEIKNMPLRIGVLFYRDRLVNDKKGHNCLVYLTKWGKQLTDKIDSVIKALAGEKEANCSSEDVPEVVLDGINRVLNDTQWQDNHFKTIFLVGDAPPHPVNDRKNPMKLSVPVIIKEAKKKNIRFLTFKLGSDDRAFKELAVNTVQQNKGRYKNIPQSPSMQTFKRDLLEAMTQEWGMLTTANAAVEQAIQNNTSAADILNDSAFRQKYNVDQYAALIIRARLPDTGTQASQIVPEFVKGWIPQEIQNQLVVGEFIFMDKIRLTILAATLESISEAALIGMQDGGEAFITTLRNVLAAQLRVQPSQLFRSGESLASILKKANVLPFKTDILMFTASEPNTWKPEDYRRINTILKEKVKVLREFIGVPSNLRYFGDTPHLYIPRAFFP